MQILIIFCKILELDYYKYLIVNWYYCRFDGSYETHFNFKWYSLRIWHSNLEIILPKKSDPLFAASFGIFLFLKEILKRRERNFNNDCFWIIFKTLRITYSFYLLLKIVYKVLYFFSRYTTPISSFYIFIFKKQ